jgi:hypothetical protein
MVTDMQKWMKEAGYSNRTLGLEIGRNTTNTWKIAAHRIHPEYDVIDVLERLSGGLLDANYFHRNRPKESEWAKAKKKREAMNYDGAA